MTVASLRACDHGGEGGHHQAPAQTRDHLDTDEGGEGEGGQQRDQQRAEAGEQRDQHQHPLAAQGVRQGAAQQHGHHHPVTVATCKQQ